MSKRKNWIALALIFCGLLAVLVYRIPQVHFATSVVDLLPGENTEVEVLRELADRDQGRLLVLRLNAGEQAVSKRALNAFQEALDASERVEAHWIMDESALKEAGGVLFEQRYRWLLPQWMDKHYPGWRSGISVGDEDVAATLVDELEAFLDSPEAFAFSDMIPSDPFLLLNQLIELGDILPAVSKGDGVFLWIKQADSPFVEAGQDVLFADLDRALEEARVEQADLEMLYTGVSVFAQASKAGIKSEIQRLNLLGLLLVLAITVFAVRALSPVMRIGMVLVLSLLSALAVVVVLFSTVHIIALVIGSVLSGIAVDYAFHLILVDRHGLDEKSVRKAVIAGSVSSALGFIVLLAAPLSFLRQVGAFVGGGLVAALIFALLLAPRQGGKPLSQGLAFRGFVGPRWLGPAFLLVVLPGLAFLKWSDRISDLEYPLPQIKAVDQSLRQQTGGAAVRNAYLVYGEDLMGAREALYRWSQASGDAGYFHAGRWMATLEASEACRQFFAARPGFIESLNEELESRGFVSDAFEPFQKQWQAYLEEKSGSRMYQEAVEQLARALPGPLQSFVHEGERLSWFMVLASEGQALEHLSDMPIMALNPSGLLSSSFGKYRETLEAFAIFCMAGILLGLVIAYGWKRGLSAFVVAAFAVLSSLAICAYLYEGLGLFHVVGALLAFCISLDYALFALESDRSGVAVPASVSISVFTTLGVFGILATSKIPGVEQLAVTIICGIGSACVLLLAGWPFLRRRVWSMRKTLSLLPHGPDAIMLSSIIKTEGKCIEAEYTPPVGQAVLPEVLVEAMAQAAAAWLIQTPQGGERREGMLVVVQSCKLLQARVETTEPVFLQVKSMADARDGFLMFRGSAKDVDMQVLVESVFSVFIPPAGIKEAKA